MEMNCLVTKVSTRKMVQYYTSLSHKKEEISHHIENLSQNLNGAVYKVNVAELFCVKQRRSSQGP